jgi:D-alanyl-D-alanine carboxypeptidase
MNPATASKLQGLAEPLRSRIGQLLTATGESVWIISGRRSIEEQVDLRRQHCGTTWADIWTKPASQCSPPTAIPGQSRHNQGLAVDLGGNLALAKRIGDQLGLVEPVKGEPWHFEVSPDALNALTGDIHVPGTDINLPTPGDILDAGGDAAGSLVSGLQRIVLVGVLLAGGVGLVVMGGIRGTQGAKP